MPAEEFQSTLVAHASPVQFATTRRLASGRVAVGLFVPPIQLNQGHTIRLVVEALLDSSDWQHVADMWWSGEAHAEWDGSGPVAEMICGADWILGRRVRARAEGFTAGLTFQVVVRADDTNPSARPARRLDADAFRPSSPDRPPAPRPERGLSQLPIEFRTR